MAPSHPYSFSANHKPVNMNYLKIKIALIVCVVFVLAHVLVVPVCGCNQLENTNSNGDIIVKRDLPARPPCWFSRCTRRRRRGVPQHEGQVEKRNQMKVREQRSITRHHAYSKRNPLAVIHFGGKVSTRARRIAEPESRFCFIKIFSKR